MQLFALNFDCQIKLGPMVLKYWSECIYFHIEKSVFGLLKASKYNIKLLSLVEIKNDTKR